MFPSLYVCLHLGSVVVVDTRALQDVSARLAPRTPICHPPGKILHITMAASTAAPMDVSMAVHIDARKGIWLHPGKPPQEIVLLANSRVQFKRNGQSALTAAHGNWCTFQAKYSCVAMQISFQWGGDDDVQLLVMHLFYQLCPGIWRTKDHMQVLIFEGEVERHGGMWCGREERVCREQFDDTYKHCLCWLHPGRAVAFVGLKKNNTVVFIDEYGSKGVENGSWHYGDVDGWLLKFNACGSGPQQSTRVQRVCRQPVFRAVGDASRRYSEQDWLGYYYWHMVAVQLF